MLIGKITGNKLIFPSSFDVLDNHLFLFNRGSFKVYDTTSSESQPIAQLRVELPTEDLSVIYYNLLISDGDSGYVIANVSEDRKYVVLSWYMHHVFVASYRVEMSEGLLWIKRAGRNHLLAVDVSGGGQLLTFKPNDAKTVLTYPRKNLINCSKFEPIVLTNAFVTDDQIAMAFFDKGKFEVATKDLKLVNQNSPSFDTETSQKSALMSQYHLQASFEIKKQQFMCNGLQSTSNGFIFHSNQSIYCHNTKSNQKWKMDIPDIRFLVKINSDEFIVIANGHFYFLNSELKSLGASWEIPSQISRKEAKLDDVINVKSDGQGSFYLLTTNELHLFSEKKLKRTWDFEPAMIKLCTF